MKDPRKTKPPAADPAELVFQSPIFEPMCSFIWKHDNAEVRDIHVRILFWVASKRSAKRRTILLDNVAKFSSLVGSEAGDMKDEYIALIESVI